MWIWNIEENKENEVNSKNIKTEKYYVVYCNNTHPILEELLKYSKTAEIRFLKSGLDFYKCPKETNSTKFILIFFITNYSKLF